MFHLLRKPCLCLILAAGSAGLVSAKPPDLPVNERIECKEPNRVPPLAGTTAAPAGTVVVEEQELPAVTVAVPIDAMSPCCCAWFSECLGNVLKFFTPEQYGAVAPGRCPYMQQKEAAPQASPSSAVRISDSVLENLTKLELAQKVFQAAEECRRNGSNAGAEKGYRLVQELCPGSRWAHFAAERLNEMQARTATPDVAVQAEESTVTETPYPLPQHGNRPIPATRELQRALRNLVEVLQEGADIDVDLSAHASRRVQCEVHVGGVMYKLVVDGEGNLHYSRQSLTSQ